MNNKTTNHRGCHSLGSPDEADAACCSMCYQPTAEIDDYEAPSLQQQGQYCFVFNLCEAVSPAKTQSIQKRRARVQG